MKRKKTYLLVVSVISLFMICAAVFCVFNMQDLWTKSRRAVPSRSGGHIMTKLYINKDNVTYYSSVYKVSLEIDFRLHCVSLKRKDRVLWETDIGKYIKERHYSDFKVWRVVCYQKYIIVSWDKHSEIYFDVASGKILGVQSD